MNKDAKTVLPITVEVGDGVIWQQVDGQVVLLEMNAGRYYSLDAVGSRMWEALLEAADVTSAAQQLLAMFDIDEDTLRKDLAELIAYLVEADLLRVTLTV